MVFLLKVTEGCLKECWKALQRL